MMAHNYSGSDFSGVCVELHLSQADRADDVRKMVRNASVSVSRGGPGYGARVFSMSTEGNMKLGFFWDEGYRSIKACLSGAGIATDWID